MMINVYQLELCHTISVLRCWISINQISWLQICGMSGCGKFELGHTLFSGLREILHGHQGYMWT